MDLRARLAAIEQEIDSGRYSPGPWAHLVREIRSRRRSERAALAIDVSRISRKLHMRGGRRTMAIEAALLIELCLMMLGALILGIGLAADSNAAAIIGMILWVMAFQPTLKMSCGRILGIGYEYAYLAGVEPRFKMAYGAYLAAPRWARILTHLAGTIGSPLGALCGWLLTTRRLDIAADVSGVIFWILVAINVVAFATAIAGIRKLGSLRADWSSGGSAGLEIREAIDGFF
ncbi:MAG: hypothetical protein ACREP6_07790 [Candidatus Binataceae bacterium]